MLIQIILQIPIRVCVCSSRILHTIVFGSFECPIFSWILMQSTNVKEILRQNFLVNFFSFR